jgi:uncharacterized protein (DUF58 family)
VLTREGTAVLVLAAAIFLLATNLMSGLLFVLDALLVSVFLVGVATALLSVRGLRVARRLAPRGVEGEPVVIELTVTSPRGGRFLIVEDGWDGARARALLPHAAPGAAGAATLCVTPTRRGRFGLGPIEVSSRGPLGLFTARRRLAVHGAVTIWPRLRPVTPQVLAQVVPALETAGAAERTRHREDLYGVREYQPGDDINRIHWRSSARRGALVVREFERPTAPETTIVLDLDRRQTPERLDAAVRAAASVLRLARDHRVAATLAGWDETLVEHRDWDAAMDWLAQVVPCGPPLADVLPAVRGRGGLIAVSSTAAVSPDPRILWILPADEVFGRGPAAGGLVYTPDGTVQAW